MCNKFSCLLILFFCISTHTFSQKVMNLYAGTNYSRLNDMGPEENKSYRYGPPEFDQQISGFIGITFYKPNDKLFRIEYGLNLTSKFISIEATTGGKGSHSTTKGNYKLVYADFSIYPGIVLGKTTKFIFYTGPNLGLLPIAYRTGMEYNVVYVNEPYNQANTWDNEISHNGYEDFKFYTFDIKAGMRIEYTVLKTKKMYIESCYSRGLVNISNYGEFRYKFNNVSIGIGLVLDLTNANREN